MGWFSSFKKAIITGVGKMENALGIPEKYSVNIGNWTKYVSSHTGNNTKSRSTFVIGKDGGGTYDPAKGCMKEFNSTYKCGNGKTKNINITKEAWGKSALYDCSKEQSICINYRLTLTDTGNITITNNNNNIIWQSNTFKVGLSLDKYKAIKSKYGRNYIIPGEYLEENEFIGSPSGNCYILMTKDGLQLCYEISDCKINDKNIGYGLSDNAYTLYSIPLVNEENIEKTGYLSYGGLLTESKENFTANNDIKSSLSSSYLNLGNYNSTNDELTINKFNNFDTELCKNKCDDTEDCGGFYISKNKLCELKKYDIKQNNFRKEDSDGLLYIKTNKLPKSSTHSNKITNITGVQWDKYNRDKDSEIKKLTELGIITEEESKDLLKSKEDLQDSNKKFMDSINKFALQNAQISEESKNDIAEFRDNLNKYSKMYNKSKNIKANINNLNAMKTDSELQLIQDNKEYLIWSIATILVVIGSIKIVNQN